MSEVALVLKQVLTDTYLSSLNNNRTKRMLQVKFMEGKEYGT